MKKYIIIIYSFSVVILNAQNSAKVNYIVYPTGGSLEKNQDVLKSKVSKSFYGVDNVLKKLEYELIIEGNKSFFHLISSLDFDEKAARIARAFSGHSDYYSNLEKNEVIEIVDFSGELFNVLLKINRNWKFINEVKEINGFKCYKALSEKKYPLKKTNNVIEIVAWYCPSIPYSFGPKEYGGLPGLIFELKEDKITYLISKIDLDTKSKKNIKEITEKTISKDDYYKIIERSHENILNTMVK